MSVQILGGKFKGLSLQIPQQGTRPTTVMLRRRIFDRYQDLSGAIFVDACAGSGAMGLEALSRGAEQVFFIESHKNALKLLEKNMQAVTHVAQKSKKELGMSLISQNVASYLNSFPEFCRSLDEDRQKEIIFFIDPPYEEHKIYHQVVKIFFEEPFFKGKLWVESECKKGLPLSFWQASPYEKYLTKSIEQGLSYLILFDFSRDL